MAKPQHRSSQTTSVKPVDVQAQQQSYDLGLKFYTQEKYEEARQAWKHVVELGSHTELANKARENLKKTDQILKTLQEIQK